MTEFRQPIRTVGHGTASADEFADLLEVANVDLLVDVRRFPGSRRHPQFNSGEMERWLPQRGIEYRWIEDLGGRRKGAFDSPNAGLRNPQFRAYADHMSTERFRDAVEELLASSSNRSVAVMCAESVWWRCHRRLLADYLVLVGEVKVEHLLPGGRMEAHPPTPEARRLGDTVVYDGGQQTLVTEEDLRLSQDDGTDDNIG